MPAEKKHKFYYSEAMYDSFHRCWVKVDGKWVEYTEWCVGPDQHCNFKDAVLVYSTDDDFVETKYEKAEDYDY